MSSLVNEEPTGPIDGVNQTFSTSVPYALGSLRAYTNGALIPSDCIDQSGYLTGKFVLLLNEPLLAGWTLEVVYLDPAGSAGGSSCPLRLNIRRRVVALTSEQRKLELESEIIKPSLEQRSRSLLLRSVRSVNRIDAEQRVLILEGSCPV